MTRLGLDPAPFSSARHKFPITMWWKISQERKGLESLTKKKIISIWTKRGGGSGREALGGVGDFFPKKHLEKQSGVNKETATHCPPNK